MLVKVNGELIDLGAQMTILDFLNKNNICQIGLVIQHNLQVVKKEDWGNTLLKENDELEVLSFVGGG